MDNQGDNNLRDEFYSPQATGSFSVAENQVSQQPMESLNQTQQVPNVGGPMNSRPPKNNNKAVLISVLCAIVLIACVGIVVAITSKSGEGTLFRSWDSKYQRISPGDDEGKKEVDPGEIEEPETPEEPEEPEEPEQPEEPAKPSKPEKPSEPSQPSQPDQPSTGGDTGSGTGGSTGGGTGGQTGPIGGGDTPVEPDPIVFTHYKYISEASDISNRKWRGNITRGEFTKWICLANNISPITKYAKIFEDVTTDTENWGYIHAAYRAGFVSGTGGGNFKPNDYLSRAEAAAVMVKMGDALNIDYSSTTCKVVKFSDIVEGTTSGWIYTAVTTAAARCIVQGSGSYISNTPVFKPDDKIIKADLVLMINKALLRNNHEGFTCEWPEGSSLSSVSANTNGLTIYYKDLVEAAFNHICTENR